MGERMRDGDMVDGGIHYRVLQDDADAIRLCLAEGLESTEGDNEGMIARWGAFDGEDLVGTICLRQWHDMAIVGWMAVNGRYQGRGIGRRLLAVREEEAVRRGIGRLGVAARAPGFYWANGFQPVDDGREAKLLLGGCLSCEQYGTTCTPRAATKVLDGTR